MKEFDWNGALDRLVEIAESAASTTDRASRRFHHGEAKGLLNRLDWSLDEVDGRGYIREKLTQARWSLEAIFGVNRGNGHPAEQHVVWVRGAVSVVRSKPRRAWATPEQS